MLKNKNVVLLLLAFVFAAPGIAAYIVFQHPHWLGSQTTNKGTLLNPPALLSGLDQGKAHWGLLLWQAGDCDDVCQQQVDKLARIRLALGRRLYDVNQWLILPETASPLPAAWQKAIAEQNIQVLRLSAEQQQSLGSWRERSQVFIADKDNYLILAFALSQPPADIFHDLNYLVKSTEKGS